MEIKQMDLSVSKSVGEIIEQISRNKKMMLDMTAIPSERDNQGVGELTSSTVMKKWVRFIGAKN